MAMCLVALPLCVVLSATVQADEREVTGSATTSDSPKADAAKPPTGNTAAANDAAATSNEGES
ncbi:MAG: hypothetical protein KDA89_20560, partial [Planctomycetaceae bacterium]|nr:hypothetical protein [Planctomycetaceae bacterium]